MIGFGYDDANRRTTTTLANGLVITYGYDNANQLISITYSKGGITIGDLGYVYDAAGRRTNVTGSLATTNLPAAVASAAHNANNQLTSWAGATLTYDLNGNLTGDGTNTYTWNARGQLLAISGGASASFVYDGVGRRRSKTVNSAQTGFLYDGMNFVQELTGSTVNANLITSGIDEVFLRKEGSTASHFMADAVGSVIALTDAAGVVQTQYSFEPYGQASTSGAANNNSQRYTAREEDGTGLLYYRARYYSASKGRFISEDPIGFAGGPNFYGYVLGNPVSFSDPFGLDATSWSNTNGGRSRWDGPTNGNWGGKCWSGGRFSCGVGGPGDAPPLDSGDQCYRDHDLCYVNCAPNNRDCIRGCDTNLLRDLDNLADDPRRWPRPPRQGTEGDSRRYRDFARRYFR